MHWLFALMVYGIPTHLQYMLISGFQIFFCMKFNLSISMFSQKCSHLFSVFYYESLALNTISCAHFCLYSWHETYKNCVWIISLYLMLHIFYYSGILYPVFIAYTIISVLQVYWVVPIWSSSYAFVFVQFPDTKDMLSRIHLVRMDGIVFFFLSNNFHVLQTSATNKMKMKIQYKI